MTIQRDWLMELKRQNNQEERILKLSEVAFLIPHLKGRIFSLQTTSTGSLSHTMTKCLVVKVIHSISHHQRPMVLTWLGRRARNKTTEDSKIHTDLIIQLMTLNLEILLTVVYTVWVVWIESSLTVHSKQVNETISLKTLRQQYKTIIIFSRS